MIRGNWNRKKKTPITGLKEGTDTYNIHQYFVATKIFIRPDSNTTFFGKIKYMKIKSFMTAKSIFLPL
jgi:hypothetical protein